MDDPISRYFIIIMVIGIMQRSNAWHNRVKQNQCALVDLGLFGSPGGLVVKDHENSVVIGILLR